MEDSSTRLWLVRHGEPDLKIHGRCYGSLDIGLSETGFAEAREIARKLRNEPLDAIYTSPRLRCRQTAELLSTGRACQMEAVEGLSEIDFGEFEGRSYDEIKTASPELYRTWMDKPTEVKFPGGESFTIMAARVKSAAESIRRLHAGAGVAVVTHSGCIRVLLAAALAMPDEGVFRLAQRYGAINLIKYYGDHPVVEIVNLAP